MAKIKFGEQKIKRDNGFIEKNIVAYADVTKTCKNIFGDVIKAYLMLETYYEGEPIDNWKKRVKEEYYINNLDRLEIDGQELYIEFSKGKIVKIITSEWGTIYSHKRMIEID